MRGRRRVFNTVLEARITPGSYFGAVFLHTTRAIVDAGLCLGQQWQQVRADVRG